MFVALFAAISFSACNSQTPQAPKANLKTVIDSLSYAYGINMEQMGLNEYLTSLGVDPGNTEDVIRGVLEAAKVDKKNKKEHARMVGLMLGQQIMDQMFANINKQVFATDTTQTLDKNQFLAGFVSAMRNKDLLLEKESVQPFVEAKSMEIREGILSKEKVKNEAYLEENKKKEGVVTLPSGVQYKVIKEGTGPKPKPEETVKVAYVGKTIDGAEFDNSADNEDGFVIFSLDRVIPGWAEGLQLMSVGSKYMLYIPSALGYGERGTPGGPIGANATLIFEVELLDIVKNDEVDLVK
jgi:FKBP-type peptidyl-prolyl cis-trans isomerase FklB